MIAPLFLYIGYTTYYGSYWPDMPLFAKVPAYALFFMMVEFFCVYLILTEFPRLSIGEKILALLYFYTFWITLMLFLYL